MSRLAIALVHYPILARDRSVVTTAITNLDIHDIARSSFTYGIPRYYIVHPVAAQRELATRVKEHWTNGSGAQRIPDRRPPMESLCIVENIKDARADWAKLHGTEEPAELWVTSAQPLPSSIRHVEAAEKLKGTGPPALLTLGTGWGLAPEITDSAAVSLAPIESPRADGYNHLSVRAAAAIFLDRLLGD